MKTAWSHEARAELVRRFASIDANAAPKWGRFTAPRMVAHVTDAIRLANGELPCRPKGPSFLRWPPVRYLFVHVLPFPKGAPTARELLRQGSVEWSDEQTALREALERFGQRDRRGPWPEHPAFGAVDAETWGALVYKHCDHHLRQFGA